jgi:pyruvate formate-lyase activating enzyme-like uncharacterized protein
MKIFKNYKITAKFLLISAFAISLLSFNELQAAHNKAVKIPRYITANVSIDLPISTKEENRIIIPKEFLRECKLLMVANELANLENEKNSQQISNISVEDPVSFSSQINMI